MRLTSYFKNTTSPAGTLGLTPHAAFDRAHMLCCKAAGKRNANSKVRTALQKSLTNRAKLAAEKFWCAPARAPTLVCS